MEVNKDGGTSVGFSDLNRSLNKNFKEKNKVCEHEWIESTDFGYNGKSSRWCKRCHKIEQTDFKIEENLSQINKQQWEDIYKSFSESFEYKKATQNGQYDILYLLFFKWMKENYLAPEKK